MVSELYSCSRKAVVLGCGLVGSACAFSLMQSGIFSEIVMVDTDKSKAEGEALDISHGVPFSKPVNVYAGGYEDIDDAEIIIITAGINQKPKETRLNLINANINVFKSIIPEITKTKFNGILLVVSNPVDILTMVTLKLSCYSPDKVFGSGTILDSARLKNKIGNYLNIDSRNVHSFVIGEHGDSEIALLSHCNISGIPLAEFCKLRGLRDYRQSMESIINEVKNSAYEIIEKKGATYFGIAMAVKRICEAIFRNERTILSVSVFLEGEYDIHDICLSIPAIIGRSGVETKLLMKLTKDDMLKIQQTAKNLKKLVQNIIL